MAEAQRVEMIEVKCKQKYRILQRMFVNLERDNERILYTLRKAKESIRILRAERSLLFERLQKVDATTRIKLTEDAGEYKQSDSETEQPHLMLLTPDEERKIMAGAAAAADMANNTKRRAASATTKKKELPLKGTSKAKGARARKAEALANNSPRRPMNPYIMFTNHLREQLKDELRIKGVGEQAKYISQRWKELNDQEKQTFKDMAERDSQRYASEKLNLNAASDITPIPSVDIES